MSNDLLRQRGVHVAQIALVDSLTGWEYSAELPRIAQFGFSDNKQCHRGQIGAERFGGIKPHLQPFGAGPDQRRARYRDRRGSTGSGAFQR